MADAGTTPDTLLGIEFPDVFRAQEFLTAATRLAAHKDIELRDAVIVVSNAEGRVTVRERATCRRRRPPSPERCGPACSASSSADRSGGSPARPPGRPVARSTAKLVDHGIPDEWVDWFRQAVRPGATIVALLVGDARRQAVFDELKRFEGARLVYANVPEEWQSRIRDALGEAPAEPLAPPQPATGEPLPPPTDPGRHLTADGVNR